jgi:hypothetical protein
MLSFQHDGEARGYEAIATTASIGFTSSFYNYSSVSNMPMKAALVTVETADIRFTLDGTVPTTTATTAVGHLITSGQNYVVRGYENCKNFRCINAVAASGATVKATYFY